MHQLLGKAAQIAPILVAGAVLSACNSDPSSGPAPAASGGSADASLHTAAERIVKAYTELMRTAATRPVRAEELRAAGIDPKAEGVKDYLADIREASSTGQWLPNSFDIRWSLDDVKSDGETTASVKANIGYQARTPGSGLASETGALDPHVIQLELRDGRWTMVKDYVNYTPNAAG